MIRHRIPRIYAYMQYIYIHTYTHICSRSEVERAVFGETSKSSFWFISLRHFGLSEEASWLRISLRKANKSWRGDGSGPSRVNWTVSGCIFQNTPTKTEGVTVQDHGVSTGSSLDVHTRAQKAKEKKSLFVVTQWLRCKLSCIIKNCSNCCESYFPRLKLETMNHDLWVANVALRQFLRIHAHYSTYTCTFWGLYIFMQVSIWFNSFFCSKNPKVVLPQLSMLDEEYQHFGPQKQIRREQLPLSVISRHLEHF